MEVSKAKKYTIIVDNEWLKKAKVLLDYELCKLIIRCDSKVFNNNINSEVTPVMQKSTNVETIDSEYQVEGNITPTAKKEGIDTNPQNSLTVETT
ncbi:hypothetical protein G9A89_011190 [Geosiphon pyriformis]|nr:hypothetical protein G9A89_011190 [Geosiphon pyriformis]